jgi:hypothetical protein
MASEPLSKSSKNSGQGTATDDGHEVGDDGHHHADRTSYGNSDNQGHDRRPLAGYAGIMASYGVLTAGSILLLRRKRFGVHPLSPWNFVLYALAAEHISRLISKDSVTSPLRSPFTAFKEPAGEGEENDEVIGSGPRRAIGELLTCPFCLDQWVTTALVAGSVAAPTLTTAVVSVSALARTADYLHLFYGLLRERVD